MCECPPRAAPQRARRRPLGAYHSRRLCAASARRYRSLQREPDDIFDTRIAKTAQEQSLSHNIPNPLHRLLIGTGVGLPSLPASTLLMSLPPPSPKLGPSSADEGAFPSSSLFGAFGKSATFKAPLNVQIGSFTREDAGFVNYDIMVMRWAIWLSLFWLRVLVVLKSG